MSRRNGLGYALIAGGGGLAIAGAIKCFIDRKGVVVSGSTLKIWGPLSDGEFIDRLNSLDKKFKCVSISNCPHLTK